MYCKNHPRGKTNERVDWPERHKPVDSRAENKDKANKK